LFFQGATAPSGPGFPRYRGIMMTLRHTTLDWLFWWTSDDLDTEISAWRHATFTGDRLPCPGGIRNRNPNNRAAADPRRRPRGHWDF